MIQAKSQMSQITNENVIVTKEKRATLSILSFVAFINMFGVGLILPIIPRLIGEMDNLQTGSAAEIGGWLLFVYSSMQFLLAPLVGALSDRFGRRPIVTMTLCLLGVDYAIMAWAPSLSWLFAGRLISGVLGSTSAATYSCIADLFEPHERGRMFGVLGGASAAGFVLGPALGGILGEIETHLPFFIASCLAMAGAVAALWLLPETLKSVNRRSFSIARANPIGSIRRMARVRGVFAFLLVIFFMQLSSQAYLSVWAYWGEEVMGWMPSMSGLTVSLYAIMLGIVQAFATGRMIERFGSINTARYALILGLPAYLMLAFATSTWIVIIALLFGSIAGITFPVLQSLMTDAVEADHQGELQGAIASTISLTAIIGPLIMSKLFSVFSDGSGLYLPGAPYLLSFILLLVAASVLWAAPDR
jgi:MFS transporter, DHA1 family, tetracycline resistance protein